MRSDVIEKHNQCTTVILTYAKDVKHLCKDALQLSSGLLIGQSTPPPTLTHGARGHDSTHSGDDQLGAPNVTSEGL